MKALKKISALVIVACIAVTMMSFAFADEKVLDGNEDRNITINEAGLNEVQEGISPTTGRTLSEITVPDGFAGLAATGKYMPMLVQIDNDNGGVVHRSPWGVNYADVIYETPLYEYGATRMSFLFSDLIPDSVGPVRSARVGHVWLREEWDCGFVFFGQQTKQGANVVEEFKKTGANKKGLLFSGIVSKTKPWMKYYSDRAGLASPHHRNANAAGMVTLIPEEHVAPNHAFLFTDEAPAGDDATEIAATWDVKEPTYSSRLMYNADTKTYARYMLQEDKSLIAYEDHDTHEQVNFSNVIIQFAPTDWVASNAPVTHVIGEGNADFFMDGKHIAGYWKRPDMENRTVFYSPDGNELKLQRGKTLIVIIPAEKTVTYK